MFGTNKILSAESGDGLYLKVNSIFDTIQGEGIYSGFPSIFIRLAGCNLACKFCDTEFDAYEEIHIDDILKKVNELSPDYKKLIVLTGGEPFRQPISLICQKLVDGGFKVQIETNGLLYRKIPEKVDVVCSPKNTGAGYKPIRKDLLTHVKALKFLISSSNELYQEVAEVGQKNTDIKIYVQPIDEMDAILNRNNEELAMKIAIKHNAILSLQIHKILGIT